ncbi:MAG: hypothetical protein OEO71_05235 [Gammaproteobacteria bacterium]|nr:hypothetical protein [Gammaproteobacteria bacterium]
MKRLQLEQCGSAMQGKILVLAAIFVTVLVLSLSTVAAAKTVHVPKPTGVPSVDWHNIQATLDSAKAGDKVRFRKGVYVLGTDSDFLVVDAPQIRLIGHQRGTTIIGGQVLPIEGEPGSPYLGGNRSLLQSPPRGFHLTGDKQSISNIRFEGFRTSILIGFGNFVDTGGYVVEDCEFIDSMYGIQAHVESDDVSAIRGNSFINNMYGYMISGGKYHVSYNYSASPEPERIPVDGYTHASGSLQAGNPFFGSPFFDEGQAPISENNVFEHNIVDGVEDGIQLAALPGGLIRNNLIRNNEFHDMTFWGTMAFIASLGGDAVGNAFVDNKVDGSWSEGFLILNFAGASVDGNVLVGNEMTSILGVFGDGVYIWGATNTILLDNIINGVNPGALGYGAVFEGGHSNQFLLNDTDADTAALFFYSPDGLFAADSPADVAVDEIDNPVESIDPNQDFTRLLSCKEILTEPDADSSIAEQVLGFRSCVDVALEEPQ